MSPTQHPARTMSFEALLAGMTQAVEAKLIKVVTDGPLTLFNYTNHCVFEKAWNPFTLMARGLIVDTEARRIVATPLTKFFNVGEYASGLLDLPNEPFEVTEKMDGSLGIIFFHGGRWRCATRGSFHSEQAQWGQAFLDRQDLLLLDPDVTYLAEIIYGANRIVVRYPEDGLVLLTAFDRNGVEFTRMMLTVTGAVTGWKVAPIVTETSLDKLIDVALTMDASSEGFVVRFAGGLRVKIKGDEYCRLHRLVSRITPLGVYDLFVNLHDLDALAKDIPEEFRVDFETIRGILENRADSFYATVKTLVESVSEMDDKSLGQWIAAQKDSPFLRWIFPSRKSGFLSAIHTDPAVRKKAFLHFRPTANQLEGYTPTSAMHHFTEEMQ